MKIQMISVSDIKPYERNPRKNEKAVDVVAASIKEYGFKQPVILNNENVIVCGHTRVLAAIKLDITEVPCIIASDLSEEQIKAFRLVDNKVGEIAEWDTELLPLEIADITADLSVFGFEQISEEEFGDNFTLESGDKKPFQQISLTLHDDQAALLHKAIKHVYDAGEVKDYGGNENRNGNGIYEVVRQWAEQRKLY